MSANGRVGSVARALGFAGLLPQVGAVSLIAIDPRGGYDIPVIVAFGYASLILSFLGGIWWGFAMRRSARQAPLAAAAVIPSLLPPIFLTLAAVTSWTVPLMLLGLSIMLTLVVDRRLVADGDAPEGWMALRTPLSLGLGLLTIAAGALAGGWTLSPNVHRPAGLSYTTGRRYVGPAL